jgi:hypothetical protein
MSIQDNFTVDAGGTFNREFVYKDDEGEVIDLTGYQARAQIRTSPFSAIVLRSEPAIDPETFLITMTWSAAQTSRLLDSNYIYSLELYNDTTEDVVVLTRGVVTVNQRIVR